MDKTKEILAPPSINNNVKAEVQPDGTYILRLNQLQLSMLKNIIDKYNKSRDASRESMRKKRGTTKEFTQKSVSVRINIE